MFLIIYGFYRSPHEWRRTKCEGSILRLGEWYDTSLDDNRKTAIGCDKF
mgnify:CR=1 FL=1|jgi:hypothetical protein